jgi:DNA-binding response OmpR family regulator
MSNLNKDVRIYLAIRKANDRSKMEDTLVLDGFDVSSFPSADDLWDVFQQRQARIVITDRRFGGGLSGLDLARRIRKDFLLPYCYIVVLSMMNRLKEIEEGMAAGADDYIIKPHNPFQLRSRLLVGLRWLAYIDSLHAKDTAAKASAQSSAAAKPATTSAVEGVAA